MKKLIMITLMAATSYSAFGIENDVEGLKRLNPKNTCECQCPCEPSDDDPTPVPPPEAIV